jgi:hypothetical protein
MEIDNELQLTPLPECDGGSPAIDDFARKIKSAWLASVTAIIECGRLLIKAKAELGYGHFEAMCEDRLPFSKSVAERLMAIARDPRLTNPEHVPLLPPSWPTLHALSRLDDEAFEQKIKSGAINPDMKRADAATEAKPRRESSLATQNKNLKEQLASSDREVKRLTALVAELKAKLADREKINGEHKAERVSLGNGRKGKPSKAKPKQPCTVDGCENDQFCRKLCQRHYNELRQSSDFVPMTPKERAARMHEAKQRKAA